MDMLGDLMLKLETSMLAIIRTCIVPINGEGYATEIVGYIVADIEENIVPQAAVGVCSNIGLQIELDTDSY